MKRRAFITLLGSAAAWPLAARAQQGERMRRIGVLMGDFPENAPEARAVVAALREELQKLGWMEGRNIQIDFRWAAADIEAMQRFAKELVGSQPELIFSTNTPATATLLQQTRTIPVVFVQVTDPVGSGFVASIPRPGGNVTGFITMAPTMAGKWVEMLKEIAPQVKRAAFLFNPATAPYFEYYLNPFKSRRSVLRSGGDRRPRSRRVRARIRYCRTGEHAERWPDRDAG
jgi:putative ABC transport system substrate-binding protein